VQYFCGVDGGGSKTVCVVGDEEGRVLGVGLAGPSNLSIVGLGAACREVRSAVATALEAAGAERARVVFAALAGAGSERRRRLLLRELRGAGPWDEVFVGTDAVAALMAATLGRPGVVVIAGTGSIALAVDAEGRVYRAGGWGWLVDDEGGGFYLGREAVRRALMAYDGRGRATLLLDLLLARFGARSIEEIVDRISLGEIGVTEVASLAPLVLEAYRRGDPVAVEVVRDACRSLAIAAAAAARRAGLQGRVMVGICGGVFEGSAEFREEFARALRAEFPGAVITGLAARPVIGALLLAYRSAGIELTEQLITNVLKTAARYRELRHGGQGGRRGAGEADL